MIEEPKYELDAQLTELAKKQSGVQEQLRQIFQERLATMQAFAQTYITETNQKASEITLVEKIVTQDRLTVQYWFEPKPKLNLQNEAHETLWNLIEGFQENLQDLQDSLNKLADFMREHK